MTNQEKGARGDRTVPASSAPTAARDRDERTSAPADEPEPTSSARAARRPIASVTLLRNELYVEVQDAGAIEVVDRALLAALMEAGVGAGKDGPHVATAVHPPICYGKIKVAARDDDFVRRHLEAARRAALLSLREARCLIADRR